MFGIDVNEELFDYKMQVETTKFGFQLWKSVYSNKLDITTNPGLYGAFNHWLRNELLFSSAGLFRDCSYNDSLDTLMHQLDDDKNAARGLLVVGLASLPIVSVEAQILIYKALLLEAQESGKSQSFVVTFSLADIARVCDPDDELGLGN